MCPTNCCVLYYNPKCKSIVDDNNLKDKNYAASAVLKTSCIYHVSVITF